MEQRIILFHMLGIALNQTHWNWKIMRVSDRNSHGRIHKKYDTDSLLFMHMPNSRYLLFSVSLSEKDIERKIQVLRYCSSV